MDSKDFHVTNDHKIPYKNPNSQCINTQSTRKESNDLNCKVNIDRMVQCHSKLKRASQQHKSLKIPL